MPRISASLSALQGRSHKGIITVHSQLHFFFIAVYKTVCLRKIKSNQDSIRIYVVWS